MEGLAALTQMVLDKMRPSLDSPWWTNFPHSLQTNDEISPDQDRGTDTNHDSLSSSLREPRHNSDDPRALVLRPEYVDPAISAAILRLPGEGGYADFHPPPPTRDVARPYNRQSSDFSNLEQPWNKEVSGLTPLFDLIDQLEGLAQGMDGRSSGIGNQQDDDGSGGFSSSWGSMQTYSSSTTYTNNERITTVTRNSNGVKSKTITREWVDENGKSKRSVEEINPTSNKDSLTGPQGDSSPKHSEISKNHQRRIDECCIS